VRRRALLWTLLAASPGLRADEAETPFLVFREADAPTAKRIQRDLVTEKQLGGRVPDTRRRTREDLARIGPWSVPFLDAGLRKGTAQIRLNAAITLVLIRDPRGLPVLREAAQKDDDISVRRAATLAIGTFECGEDFERLRDLPEAPRGEWRSAAPALARLRHRHARPLLRAKVEPGPRRSGQHLPKDAHDAAAVVISAAIASPEVWPVDLLDHEQDLVQEAAAAGLAIRPLPESRAGELLAALPRTKGRARVLAIRALGAIAPRPPKVQAELLAIACRDGTADERIAALLELEGQADELDPLLKAYGRVAGRNDPVTAVLLFALAKTREEEATRRLRDVLRTGSPFLRFYAGASLLYLNGSEELRDPIRSEVWALGDELREIAQRMGGGSETARKAAFADLCRIDDPRDLRLFVAREERNWHEVNRLLARIFELDEVLTVFDSSRPGRKEESAVGGGSGGEEARKAPSVTDAEQDLFDLLLPTRVEPPAGQPDYPERRPYFGPEDLCRG
jgi:HEAT repeat protein